MSSKLEMVNLCNMIECLKAIKMTCEHVILVHKKYI